MSVVEGATGALKGCEDFICVMAIYAGCKDLYGVVGEHAGCRAQAHLMQRVLSMLALQDIRACVCGHTVCTG